MIQPNVRLKPAKKLSAWRKIAIGTWHGPGDPSVYGVLELNAEPALRYIELLKSKSNERITITHFVGKVAAESIRRHPQINSILRFGRIYPREDLNIFFQVASDSKGENLSGKCVRNIDKMSIEEISRSLNAGVKQIRDGDEGEYKKGKQLMGMIPGFLSGIFLNITAFISYTLNIWHPALGIPKDGFGCTMITNIGSLGLDMAFAPIVPYSRVPFLIAVGTVYVRAVVENGTIKPQKSIKLCVTFDHRLVDGIHASQMAQTVVKLFDNPEKEFEA